MKKQMDWVFSRGFARLRAAFTLCFLLACAGSLAAAESTPAPTGPANKVKGTFEWSAKPGERHDLEGTLTKTSENTWKVTWNFTWGNRPVTYQGTVQGNLTSGSISGTGDDSQRKRTFAFEGTANAGTWKFDCFDITQGKRPVGSGELTVQK